VLTPFDVVIVPFPYTDRLSEKRRPAVVISAPSLTRDYGLVWLLMVTSADNPRWPCDVEVSDLKKAGLPAPSLIRPAKIATADAARILRRIGQLPPGDASAVRAKLKALEA
jgi:mRNA interferase MazF